jgi:hypothetical protein
MLVAFLQSLALCAQRFNVTVACVDNASVDALRRLEHYFSRLELTAVPAQSIPGADAARVPESALLTCWSLKPYVLRHLLIERGCQELLYLDADMYVLDDGFVEIFETSFDVLLSPHGDHDFSRVPALANLHVRFGAINGGCMFFRNTPRASRVLDWVCERVAVARPALAPHHQALTTQRFLKQFYREQHAFSAIYYMHDEVGFIDNPGINLGPWHLDALSEDGDGHLVVRGPDGRVHPLLLFHMHGFELDRELRVQRRNMTDDVWERPAVRRIYDGWTRLYAEAWQILARV